MGSCVLFVCRSVGQHPFHRFFSELQHPAAGGGVRAAVRGRQRSALRPQHLQHLHTWKPHGECRDAASHVTATQWPPRATYHKFSPVFQALMEDKLIIALSRLSRTPLCSSNSMGIGLNAPGVYSRGYWRESELSDAARTLSVCPSLFSLPVYIIHTLVFSPFLSIAPSIYLFFHLYLLSELSHPYPPPPLFADWLGCFPWTEEAVSKQRQRQSGTSLQLFSLLSLLLLLFRHFFFEKHLEGFICLLSYYWRT